MATETLSGDAVTSGRDTDNEPRQDSAASYKPCQAISLQLIYFMMIGTKAGSAEIIGELPASIVEDVTQAVSLLSSIEGVTTVWLFGSAAKNRPMDWRSDLDFAVEGLASGREFEAWSELDERLSCPLDLIRCEDASPLLLSEIQKGIVLYEA